MSLWRQLTRGLRVLGNRSDVDHDDDDEVRDYLARATAAHVARGLPAAEARRAALLEVGNVTVVREQVRSYGWENAIATVVTDLRYAARRLRSNPGFAVVSVLTLALGIGASTAIFSAVNPILFEPLPYPHARSILTISDFGAAAAPVDVTFGTYRELVARSRSFEAMAVLKPWQPTLVGDAAPERLDGQAVSASYFRVLGILPILGRDFEDSEDQPRGRKVVVLSDGLWRRRFAADPTVVGRQVKLNDDNYLVIGIMPGTFENDLAPSAELWTSLQYDRSLPVDGREWGHHLKMVVRLRPGVGVDQARRELASIARTRRPEFKRVPWADLSGGLIVTSLQDSVTRGVKPALLAVLGAVVLVLAIACVNVTNLLLARGAQRRGEFALRAALGAGRVRLTRQVLTESLLLAIIGGALGMAVAEIGVRALVALSPPGLPRVHAIRVDAAVFAFGFGVTTLIGLLIGLVPARHAVRDDVQARLQQSSRGSAGASHATRGALVVAEVALALVLLVSAGLLLRSLQHLFAVPAGFDPSHVLTMQVQESGAQFRSDASRNQFFARALDEVLRIPGVTTAALTSQLPLSGDLDGYGVHFERDADPMNQGSALRYAVTPSYFAAMRIPLRRGRLLDAHDDSTAPRAVLINESFAKRAFGAQDPIGQRLTFGPDDGKLYTIVGVVGDVRQTSLAMDQPDALYVTPWQWHWADQLMSLVIRTPLDPASLTSTVRDAIWSIDKNQPIFRVATMDALLAKSEAARQFALVLFEAFAIAALALAAIGIYGVLAGGVAERRREIGVRSALGAAPGDILGLVMRRGMTLTAMGIVIGLAGAAAASRALVTLLFSVSRLDPITYLCVIALMFGVAVIACWLPARRAAMVDPAITLRAE